MALSKLLRDTMRALQEGCVQYPEQFTVQFAKAIVTINVDMMSNDKAIQLLQFAYNQFNSSPGWFVLFNHSTSKGLQVFFKTKLGCALKTLELFFDKPIEDPLDNLTYVVSLFSSLHEKQERQHRHYYLNAMQVMIEHEEPKKAVDLICYLYTSGLFPDKPAVRNSCDWISIDDIWKFWHGIKQCPDPAVMLGIIQLLHGKKGSNLVHNAPVEIRSTLYALIKTRNPLVELQCLFKTIQNCVASERSKPRTLHQDIELWTKYEEFRAVDTQDRFNDVLQGNHEWYFYHANLPDLINVFERLGQLPGLLATKFRLGENSKLECPKNAPEEAQSIINAFNRGELATLDMEVTSLCF